MLSCVNQIDAASVQRGVLPQGLGNGESWLLRKSMRSVGHRVKELTTSLANADDAMGKRGRRAEMLHDMPGAPRQPLQVATPVSSPTCVNTKPTNVKFCLKAWAMATPVSSPTCVRHKPMLQHLENYQHGLPDSTRLQHGLPKRLWEEQPQRGHALASLLGACSDGRGQVVHALPSMHCRPLGRAGRRPLGRAPATQLSRAVIGHCTASTFSTSNAFWAMMRRGPPLRSCRACWLVLSELPASWLVLQPLSQWPVVMCQLTAGARAS